MLCLAVQASAARCFLQLWGDAIAQELVKRTASHLVDAAKDAHGPAAQEIEVSPVASLRAYLKLGRHRCCDNG